MISVSRKGCRFSRRLMSCSSSLSATTNKLQRWQSCVFGPCVMGIYHPIRIIVVHGKRQSFRPQSICGLGIMGTERKRDPMAKNKEASTSLVARFFSHVKKTKTCWFWTGRCLKAAPGRGDGGYGHFHIPGENNMLAHRFSYAHTYGFLPRDRFVLHKCDNPACVRPSHLYLGTHHENMRDMVKRGRSVHRFGSANPRAKLNEQKVRQIKALLEDGFKQREIATRFGVTTSMIGHIKNGRHWV